MSVIYQIYCVYQHLDDWLLLQEMPVMNSFQLGNLYKAMETKSELTVKIFTKDGDCTNKGSKSLW